jgi:CcmD family protein
MSSNHLLVAAYALIWAFAFGYLIWLGRRQAQLRHEVELLRKALEGHEGSRGRGA